MLFFNLEACYYGDGTFGAKNRLKNWFCSLRGCYMKKIGMTALCLLAFLCVIGVFLIGDVLKSAMGAATLALWHTARSRLPRA